MELAPLLQPHTKKQTETSNRGEKDVSISYDFLGSQSETMPRTASDGF